MKVLYFLLKTFLPGARGWITGILRAAANDLTIVSQMFFIPRPQTESGFVITAAIYVAA